MAPAEIRWGARNRVGASCVYRLSLPTSEAPYQQRTSDVRNWCLGRDSNPQGPLLEIAVVRRSASPVCLPIPPPGQRLAILHGIAGRFYSGRDDEP